MESYQLADAQRAALAAVRDGEVEHARCYARQVRTRHAMVGLWEQAPGRDDFVIVELAGTTRIGQSRASGQLMAACRLVEVLPATLDALETGRMFVPTAELLLQLTRHCTEPVAREVERRLLPELLEGNTTELRRRLAETVLQVEAELDPDAAAARERQAADDRNVWLRVRQDGMCEAGASMPVLTGRRWALDFDELVRAQQVADQRDGIVRTNNQRRADVFAALPSQLLALLQAIASGDLSRLLALAHLDPDSAADLQHLADTTRDLHPDHPDHPDDRADVDIVDTATDTTHSDATSDVHGAGDGDRDVTADAVTPDAVTPDDVTTDDEATDDEATDDVATDDVASDDEVGSEARSDSAFDIDLLPDPDPDVDVDVETETVPDTADTADDGVGAGSGVGGWGATDCAGLSAWALAVALLRLPVRDPRVLNVHVPMATLLDLDQRGGWVEDLGPISPYRARTLLPVAALRRVVVDSRSGQPLRIDRELLPGTDPPDWADPEQVHQAAQQARDRLLSLLTLTVVTDTAQVGHDPSPTTSALVELRDRTCTGIGCAHPARRCHKDHEQPWPDGPTAVWNVGAKSPRCHLAKHHGWQASRDEHTGVSVWLSPLGHTYRRPGVWQAPARLPEDLTLPAPRLLHDEPGPYYDDTSWSPPLNHRLPEPPPPTTKELDPPPF